MKRIVSILILALALAWAAAACADEVRYTGTVSKTMTIRKSKSTSAGKAGSVEPGELMEVHEKINAANGRGVVTLFSNHSGKYSYRLQNKKLAEKITVFGDVKIARKGEEVYLDASFDAQGAVIVFFE